MAHLLEQTENLSKPACLIMTQIEKVGHFTKLPYKSTYPQKSWEELKKAAIKSFGSSCGKIPVAVIPVQVYGGLEYATKNDKGDPVLRFSNNGFHQAYITENCQIPLLCSHP